MTFAEAIAEQAAREYDDSVQRIRAQARMRAAANGSDPLEAEVRAELLWHPGASHEPIVSEVAGPYRRKAA
jgi:hypothetical protein